MNQHVDSLLMGQVKLFQWQQLQLAGGKSFRHSNTLNYSPYTDDPTLCVS